jgi:L-2,4-diaminobutyrate decarboxylase
VASVTPPAQRQGATSLPPTGPAAERLAGGAGGAEAVTTLVRRGLAGYAEAAATRGPIPAGGPAAVRELVRRVCGEPLPRQGVGAAAALGEIATVLGAGSADPAHPWCAAHLHCPPLAVAVAADTITSVANQSLDSWDQAPAASVVEDEVLAGLAELVGMPATARGALTTGGTESNLMGLLAARDTALRRHIGGDPARDGVPTAAAGRLRIVCSRLAHFSISRGAALLGLGERAVVPVDVDEHGRLDDAAAADAIERARQADEIVIALVATAGTTDHGAIDPLGALADLAARTQVWLHVDASYGGLALLSPYRAALLSGIDRADSVALDLHKLGWQPVAAGVFLRRDTPAAPAGSSPAYLSTRDDECAGIPNLLDRSLRTTRRADAVKVLATMRALGRDGLAALVESCFALAEHAARRVELTPRLELLAQPVLTTVLFRYLTDDPARADAVNGALRRALLFGGAAVVGRTELDHADAPTGTRVALKLTLLNPDTTRDQLDALLDAVVLAGRQEEARP